MASALDTARQVIEGRLNTNWSATKIAWPNVAFSPSSGEAWIQPSLLWGEGFVSTKTGRNAVHGVLHINVFVPRGTGTGVALSYADDLRDLFNRLEVSGVRFDAPSGPQPQAGDEDWAQVAVTVGFTVEEVVA